MPKLILSTKDEIIDEYPIDKELVTIGRRTDNDICLDNLAISGYHTQISMVLNDCFIEDMNSTNGTFVNSKIVRKHALKDGDIIDIGNHRIKYINHLASSSANGEFEKTIITKPSFGTANVDESIAQIEDQILNKEKSSTGDQPVEQQSDEKNDIQDAAEDAISKEDILDENVPGGDILEEGTITEDSEEYMTAEFDKKVISAGLAAKKEENSTQDKVDISNQAKEADELLESRIDINKSLVGRIQILNGNNTGKELSLSKSLTTLGKPNIAVVGISKRNTSYYIMHIDSTDDNASKLNGEIIQGKAKLLEDHDIIDVAGIKLEFFTE